MNELVQIINNQVVVSSRKVADSFGKQHKHVLDAIKDILGVAENSADPMFLETTYTHEQNKQEYPEYLMNRDGFSLLVMGFTGKEALEWKIKFIKAFNDMEAQLHKPMSMLEIIAANAQALVEQEKKINSISNKVDGIREVVALNPTDWRRDTSLMISKMAHVNNDPDMIHDLRTESYKLLNQRMGVDVQCRLTNKRRRMADEGVCKSKRDKLNALDVIGDDKKLIEGYVAIIKEMAIKYGVCGKEA